MSNGNLPTFICIGAMKCGTTSLHAYLDTHPEVCMSSPKETGFFLERNDSDLDWYRQCFSGSAQAYGETSTDYAKHPGFGGVPERMNSLLPDIKLLYLVRDPIERAVSQYVHDRALGLVEGPVEKVLCPPEESLYVNVSRYHYQLSQYLEYYDWENICVIESEHLRNARVETLSEIFEFIGVRPDINQQQVQTEYHKSAVKLRLPAVSKFFARTNVGQVLKSIGKTVFPSSWIERGKELLAPSTEKPTVDPEVRGRLREFLREDVKRLRCLTGNEFSSWSL